MTDGIFLLFSGGLFLVGNASHVIRCSDQMNTGKSGGAVLREERGQNTFQNGHGGTNGEDLNRGEGGDDFR